LVTHLQVFKGVILRNLKNLRKSMLRSGVFVNTHLRTPRNFKLFQGLEATDALAEALEEALAEALLE
jgi:divalent metal cation (Fe/Co/Zn/Cd) transporter